MSNGAKSDIEFIHQHLLNAATPLGEPLLNALTKLGPAPLPTPPNTPFSTRLCRAVTGQQLSVKAADTIWGRLEAGAGASELVDYISQSDFDTLRSHGLSAGKIKAMVSIAEHALRGELEADDLRRLPRAERDTKLVQLRGIGPWTADMMSIFYFNDPDVWPDGDLATRNTLMKLTSPRRKTAFTAKRFAPYRSYLAIQMWRAANATAM